MEAAGGFGVEMLICLCEIVHYSCVLRCDVVYCAARYGAV